MSEVKKVRAGRPMIPVIRITNPFNPREFVRESIAWSRKKTLDAYFPLVEAAPVVVSINGKIVPNEQFSVTYLDKTDNVVICPVPTGGGGAKQVLSIVAMIAVATFAPELAVYMTGEFGVLGGLGLGAVGTGIVAAGLTMAGAVLVSSIFAPPRATNNSGASTSSYGIDGAKDTSLEGIPVPVNYGQFRLGGNILGLYVDNVADDNQILYMLLSAGEGPVGSITNIEINDNPITDYGTSIEVQTRLGLPNQTAIPWFSDVVVPQTKNIKLSTDWTYHTTTTAIDKLRLDFSAPSGLFSIDTKSGAANSVTVALEAQWRPAGSTDNDWQPFSAADEVSGWSSAVATRAGANDGTIVWQQADGVEITDPDRLAYLRQNAPFSDTSAISGSSTVRVPSYNQTLSMTSNKRSAVRRSFTSAQLESGKYEVRVRRTAPKSTSDSVVDEVYLSDVNEIVLQELSYPNTALVAVKVVLGTQINGIPKVTFMHGGRMIQTYGLRYATSTAPEWYDSASKNPAWVVWDMLTNRRFGGAMISSRLDFQAFKDWAAYCDSQGYEWNGPIDSEMNVWDATQLPLRVGHAQLVNVGTRWTVVVEKPAAPVMMFSVANMIENSYKETWLGTADRANEIDVTFFDRNDSYKQRTVKVYDPAALTAGAKQRTSAITLYGVTDYETAYKEGQFQLNLNRHILRTVDFSAPLEAVACSVGDLIYVQHDMTQWAQAGRFEGGSTASVAKLDRPVTMEAGKQYKLLVMHDAVERTTGSILNVVGTSVFLTGFSSGVPVKRIQVNGRDLRVAGTFEQGSGFGVIVDDATGLAAGQAYSLWDTDVIEEYNVVNEPGDHSAVTLQSPMTFVPAQFANWMFGASDKVKQPFRVKAVSGTHEYKRDITAIEYKEEVYDFSRYGSNTAVAPPTANAIGTALNLALYEETYISGTSIVSRVVASWAPPTAGLYAGADVYVQKNDGPLAKLIDAKNATSAMLDAAKGDKITVKVQPYDIFGKRSQFEQAPTETITVIGELTGIDVGAVTGAGFTWSGRDCKLSWRYNSTTHSYEFGSEPSGADAGALDPQFKDYEIRVYDQNMTLRRTEHTTDNSYVYIYDKNFADGLSRHLVFEVRMRDIFNNLGSPTTIDAYNPAPTVAAVDVSATFESATVTYQHSNDADFAGVIVWLAEDAASLYSVAPSDAHEVFRGPDASILLPGLMFAADYYVRVAAYDAFGPTELTPSDTVHFKTTNLNVDAIADGVLDGSKLVPALQSRIDLIDAPGSGLVAQLAAETTARATAIANEATARTNAIAAEALKRATDLLAEATTRGAAITSVQQTIQDQSQSFASQVDTITAALGDNAAAIETERTTRVTATDSLATQLTTIAAKTDNNTAAITSEQTARTTATEALATQISTVQAKTDANSAAIVSETTARTTATDSLAQQITTVSAKTDANTASITNEVTARTNALGSVTSQLNQLDTAYKSADAATLVSANSYVQNYAYSKAGADAAIAATSSTLRTEFNAGDAATLTSANSFVQNYAYSKSAADSAIAASGNSLTTGYKTYADQARTDAITAAAADVRNYSYSKSAADGAIAAQGTTLTANFTAADGATLTSAQGYVQNYAYSKADTNSAIASQVATVSARLDNVGGVTLEQKFIAQANTESGLAAQYTVKVDNNGYVSGFGLASTSVNGVPTSEFIINADKFAIVSGGGSDHPFTVGQVNGVTKTIIKSALIGDASIGTLHIGDAQVNTIKIANNAATALTSGYSGNVARGGFVSVGIVTSGGPVMVVATSGGGLLIETLILQRDGMTLLQSDAAGSDYATGGISSTASYVDQPGAGYHTYYAYRQCESGGPSGRISLTVLETKR